MSWALEELRALRAGRPVGVTTGAEDTPVPLLQVADLPGPWREWYEERAAIREYDGRQTRAEAEAAALAEVLRAERSRS